MPESNSEPPPRGSFASQACCTRAWFSHVNLEPGEVHFARSAGLEVENLTALR